jgi:ABC-type uncharacterized transport system ATPase subunit
VPSTLRSPPEKADRTIALALTSISKRFGSTVALDGASITAQYGTVHALLGENGAGKTTLMRIAFGMMAPDAGTIAVDGEVRLLESPADAIMSGIGMVHQHFTLVPAMTVVENVALGGLGVYNAAQTRERVIEVSARTGLPVDPDALVGELPVGAQQRVEIVKALVREASILILDEPTAVLAPGEARELLQNMRAFVKGGGSVVLITHKLRDVLEFADEVTVIRRGRTVLKEQAGRVDEAGLAEAMIGSGRGVYNERGEKRALRSRSSLLTSLVIDARDMRDVFRLRGVVARDEREVERLKDATLTVKGGEILGVAAVEGNGQYELLRVLARRMTAVKGSMEGPDEVGFVPEDRQRDALIMDFPLYENVELLGAGRRRGSIGWEEVREQTRALMHDYDIRAAGPNAQARTLSGGNQQKLAVGREITGAPAALVVENPTRGLDVHATTAVHGRLREARDRGTAVILYSSDLDEVIELADRVIVVYDGVVREVPRDREMVGRAMLGKV